MVNKSEHPLTEAAFVELYRDVSTVPTESGFSVPLATALQMEEMFCPADPEKRLDSERRLRYLARMIGAPALLPEHQYLLEQITE